MLSLIAKWNLTEIVRNRVEWTAKNKEDGYDFRPGH
jgi:hypothetical protein